MDPAADPGQALREVELDLAEGADFIMVKPARLTFGDLDAEVRHVKSDRIEIGHGRTLLANGGDSFRHFWLDAFGPLEPIANSLAVALANHELWIRTVLVAV